MLFLNLLKRNLGISNMKILLHQTHRKIKDIAFQDLPVSEVTPSIIKKHIKESGLIYEDGFTCFIIRCGFCDKEKKSKTYINKNTGNKIV